MRKATARQLKEHNQRLVLKNIYSGQASTRVAIAQETGLTRPTISQIVNQLLEVGLVREEGPGESSGGKPPTLLGFNNNAYQIAGVHVGGREIFGAITDLRGQILARSALPTDRSNGKRAMASLCRVLDDLLAQATRPLLGIGVSTPGLVDHLNGIVRYSAHLNWKNTPLSDQLAQHCQNDTPIYIGNDTNFAALGERVFGVGEGEDNMVVVMAGTRGIGAGLIINGEIYYGPGGGAGEIGHMPVTDLDIPCICGRRGCLEAMASGWALVRQAREAGLMHPESTLSTIDQPDSIFVDIRRSAEAGDSVAATLVQEAGHYLGLAVSGIISTINPRRVIIGGSVAELGQQFFDSVRDTVNGHTLELLTEETAILPASQGTDANILGAVAQVLKSELGVV